MARYVVERTFPDGLQVPAGLEGAELCGAIVERNADDGVTWLHSYVSDDGEKTFCVYDAPSPEAIRKTAKRNDLPVDCITQVRVLDPYFYGGAESSSPTHRASVLRRARRRAPSSTSGIRSSSRCTSGSGIRIRLGCTPARTRS